MSENLTEKLKVIINSLPATIYDYGYDNFIDTFAKQLAPEIEKMLPRWVSVGECDDIKNQLKQLQDGIATERKYLSAMTDSELLAHIRASLASDTLISPPPDSNIKP
jgi:hypothetical protein